MDFIAIDVKKGYNNLNTKVGVFVMSDTVQETALIVKIKAMMGHMSKAERRVADYIVQNQDEVIHLTVSELADLTSVSNATVIRTCQRIGSGNYQDLKITLAQEIVTPMQSINEELSFEDDPATILDKVFNTERQALDYTRNNIDMKELLRAVDVLQNAGTIHVLGMGNSRAIAQDLEHKLLRLGLNAVMRGDGHMDIISASFLKPCDVMFAISYSGSTMDVINAAKVVLTGKKLDQKVYYHHSGYVGGMKETKYRKLMAEKPEFAVKHAVVGMLPKGPLGRQMARKLRVYAGAEHEHEAQKPEVLELVK